MPQNIDKWEFGSLPWCEFAARLGIQLLSNAKLDLKGYAWGFSEQYLAIPERLLAGRPFAGYHLMIANGEISGGPGIPAECRSLPGFHVSIEWAPIAHSSYLPFNSVGHEERGEAHMRLRKELRAAGFGDGKWVLEHTLQREADACPACGSLQHARPACPVWPPGIGEALGTNPDMAAHKWRLKRSPELEGFPETEWGVPVFQEMNDDQKRRFLCLMGH